MSDWVNDRTPRAGSALRPPLPVGPSVDGWRLVVPVKGGPEAKSRLRVPDGVERPALARALALDTVAAAVETVGPASVVVVTSDPEVAFAMAGMGVRVVPDPGQGLNAAVKVGVHHGRDAQDAVAALLGDVPALRPVDLRRALTAAEAHPCSFVPDAEGTGTVLLARRVGGTLVPPRFGSASAKAHEEAGAVRLDLALPGLRRDVDDEASLRAALRLGVGVHTAALLAHLIAPGAGAAPTAFNEAAPVAPSASAETDRRLGPAG